MTGGADSHAPGPLVALGEIVGTHGVGGLLRLRPFDPASAAALVDSRERTVFLGAGAPPRPIRLRSARAHGKVLLIALDGVTSIELGAPLVGSTIAVPAADLPPPARGEYYVYQLEGLEVHTVSGERLGTVARAFPTGGNEVLVVRDGAREHLIPVIADVIRDIDLGAGRVVIEPIEGLLS